MSIDPQILARHRRDARQERVLAAMARDEMPRPQTRAEVAAEIDVDCVAPDSRPVFPGIGVTIDELFEGRL